MTAKIITIVSGKGGVGTTTAAINLSAALAGFAKKTLIIDADIGMPTIGLMLGLDVSKASLHDVLSGTAELKEAIYDGPNNLHVLPGSISLHSFLNANTEIIGGIVESIRDKYDFIVIDSPTGINKNSIFSISLADELIQVINPDIASLAGAMKIKAISDNMGKPFRGAFINRTGVTQNELTKERIENALGLKILANIEEDPNVKNSLAFKAPMVMKYPGSPASVGFNKEAAEIAGIKVSAEMASAEESKDKKKKGKKFSLSKGKK
ncbi:cell division ATPase MinD [Methanolobus profundi]|uniref:Septum site-determining protein MinD n=1 Tax=Methanolobus profundi TaxID=487685 RepID=A0A1I4S303_9EURY|nr:cell division ATPase MinD [Methanolobus profundi]SFM58650.1 septum site-determining protein MinD [Methanolobus profundi]